jgi:hypothetical protein
MLEDLSNHGHARLTNALRVLHLEADIHPMTFSPPITSDQRGEGLDDIEEAKETRGEALEGMQWPMRIQVMKMMYRTDRADDYFEDVDINVTSDGHFSGRWPRFDPCVPPWA